ncbi:peptidase inhibitor 16-like [Liolophura sinensis]|uniref:peptidase inhibitor 16-like n=1 Tax=Liolophura sinensis TaxID=3198878 RepID=UPI0031592978
MAVNCRLVLAVAVLLCLWALVKAAVILKPSIQGRDKRRVPDKASMGHWKHDDLKRGFTPSEKYAILEKHNALRKEVMAANMNRLVWSDALAEHAQDIAYQCNLEYSEVGVNIAAQSYFYNEIEATKGWYEEKSFYDYANDACQFGLTCKHYKQVVRAAATMVGCGITFCPLMNSIAMEDVYIIVCSYSPVTAKGVPYESGPPCSHCDEGRSCSDGMCGGY